MDQPYAGYRPLWSGTLRDYILSPAGVEFRERLADAIVQGIHPPLDTVKEYVKTPEGQKQLAQVRKLIAEGKHPDIEHLLK
jgi:hypothetical protein